MALQSSAQQWLVTKTNPDYVEYVARFASVSLPFAQVLINRGIKTPEQVRAFLDPRIERLTDPFSLPGIGPALHRIRDARQRNERVLVHGDYDADGLSATALMVEGLKEYGIDVHSFIPHRIAHGYGFGMTGVDRAVEVGAGLIITVDCGITALDTVTAAKARGIDVIITDHHEPERRSPSERHAPDVKDGNLLASGDFIIPDAVAVVNPKLNPDGGQLQSLSGAGVALKVIEGLFGQGSEMVCRLLDLAAIGTGADVVPVLGDNRVILKEGMRMIHSGERVGVRALKAAAGLKADFFKSSFLYFVLIPRINAAGRIADANDVVRLLTTRSEAEAGTLAEWLNALNAQRQEIEAVVYKEALAKVRSLDSIDGAIVVASEDWHPGVLGIVASKLVEEFHRPAFVFTVQEGMAKGSGRSLPAFDIHEGLVRCKALLKRFGGHRQAAGVSLRAEDLRPFGAIMSRLVSEALGEDRLLPTLRMDASVNLADVCWELVEEVSRLEPFGCGNEEPLFGARGLEVTQARTVGNNHLKMTLRQKGYAVDSIGFDLGGLLPEIEERGLVDVAFLPTANVWNGSRYLQLSIRAVRQSQHNYCG